MLTPDQFNVLRDKASQLTDPVLEFLLEDIARRVSEAGQLTSTASYQIWRAQQLGMSQREVKKELKKRLKVSDRELRKLLTQSAEVGYDFDISRLPHANAVPFNENAALQSIVQGTIEMVGNEFTNLTQTLGMVAPNGETVAIDDIYRKCCDEAFRLVNTGAADYNTAIRRATKNLADKGLRTIDYESGGSRSIEAAVRGSVMGGMGLMQEQISQQTHDEFGCDGWEISAHAASAPDHEPIQGKQYSDAEYTLLNNSLVRRIGTLNCGHSVFPIILGVNAPQYTDEELEKMRQDNADGVVIDGRHYTKYEATQMQRKIERAIRKQKNRILVDEAADDKDKLLTDQIRLQRYRQEYVRFSKAAGLRTQNERAQVAGFGRKQAAEAVAANKSVENLANSMYDIGSTEANVNAYMRDKPLRDKICSGTEYPAEINSGKQRNHIPGSHEYNQYVERLAKDGKFGPSRLLITEDEAQALVYKYRGTGILPRDKNGQWMKQELITTHSQPVGIVVNDTTGAEAETVTFKIHYGKKGTHIVPDYPSRKGMKGPK